MSYRPFFSLISIPLTVVIYLSFGMVTDSSRDELELIGSIKPRNSSQIDSSPWGIQAGTLDEDIVRRAADIGVKWTRLQADWSEVEKVKGIYQWENTDRAFLSAVNNNITPFVTLNGTNKLYISTKREIDPELEEIYGTRFLPPTSDPEAFNAWLRFAVKVVERYKDRIKYWEIWNEPNHFAYWGDEPDGKEYGRMVNAAAKLIREIDPEAKIIAGAMAGLDPEFTEEFLSAGNASLIDIVSFHNYGPIPEVRIYAALDVWAVINKYNKDIELWQGECGYPSHSSTRDYRGISPWGLRIQAKWLLRQAFTDTYFCRTSLSNYFKLFHEGGRGVMPERTFMSGIDSILGFRERNGSRVKIVGVNEKCLLNNPDLNPKPAYFAYRNLCAVMDSRYKPVDIKKSFDVKNPGTFYGIGNEDDAFPSVPLLASFKDAGDNYLISYWLPWHPQEIVECASVDLSLSDIRISNPVLVDLLEGKVYKLKNYITGNGKMIFKNIPLADYPFLIMEENQVQIVK